MTAAVRNKYIDYLKQHISNVRKGYQWICDNLPELIPTDLINTVDTNINMHDQAKFSDEEFDAYADHFYGTKSKAHDEAFDYAWLDHIHKNKHHWQYWMLQNDEDGLKCLKIPTEYLIEMICDWWAFSWNKGNLQEIFNWYDSHKKGIQMNEESRGELEKMLAQIKNKLDELKGNQK